MFGYPMVHAILKAHMNERTLLNNVIEWIQEINQEN